MDKLQNNRYNIAQQMQIRCAHFTLLTYQQQQQEMWMHKHMNIELLYISRILARKKIHSFWTWRPLSRSCVFFRVFCRQLSEIGLLCKFCETNAFFNGWKNSRTHTHPMSSKHTWCIMSFFVVLFYVQSQKNQLVRRWYFFRFISSNIYFRSLTFLWCICH